MPCFVKAGLMHIAMFKKAEIRRETTVDLVRIENEIRGTEDGDESDQCDQGKHGGIDVAKRHAERDKDERKLAYLSDCESGLQARFPAIAEVPHKRHKNERVPYQYKRGEDECRGNKTRDF